MPEKLPVPSLESIQLLTQDVGSVFQGKMNSVVVALRNALIAFNAQIDAAETASQQVEPAPEAIALEGANNTYKMTPLRSAQLIEKLLTDATADEAEALAGTSDKLITAMLLDLVLEWRLGTTGNLGTAAQRNVMTSLTDTATPNALMPREAFGLGQIATRRAPQLDDVFFNSFSSTPATWNNSPYPGIDANNQGAAITLKHEDQTYWWNLWFGLGREEIRFRRIAAGIAGSWRTLYQNSNIVGVVSHSAGMPTGGILYYGENPTGKYLLLADGTGFWWKRVNFSGLVINPAANGNLNTSIDCDISQPFSLLNPVISLSAAVCKTSGGQIVYVVKQDSGLPIIVNTGHMPSTSWPYLDTVGTAVITNGYYELSAVGRWY